jgi:hypothetical protein
MNNKILYDKITKILKGEDENYRETLEIIKKELETEIITGGKINNSIKQAFKRLQNQNNIKTKFQNVLRNGDDKYTITNSYFLITYTGEKLPKELKAYINPNEKEIDDGLQFDRLRNMDGEISKVSINYENLLKIHKYNKLNKLDDMYTLSGGLTFDIEYFLDIITLLGQKDLKNVEIEISANNCHPMNIISENGKAILLPIRMDEDKIENRLKLQEKIIKGE